ncbi:hypothetical protein [Entomobacter blattae]|uniref:Uncharacterized protein n=1 Tax=Entomobacter blattae TaxID=2762277 RepID=A0A7H1NU68_9PROT|nr:hypothetical protein [Entomobacter blattae]QNT79328.1 hypothetical protein JGUZn3_21250 [Entomobacter blattae]
MFFFKKLPYLQILSLSLLTSLPLTSLKAADTPISESVIQEAGNEISAHMQEGGMILTSQKVKECYDHSKTDSTLTQKCILEDMTIRTIDHDWQAHMKQETGKDWKPDSSFLSNEAQMQKR